MGLGYKCCTDPNPQDRTESRQGRTTPVLGRAQLLAQTQGALCTGRCATGMGPCPVWSLALPRAAGQWVQSWANAVLQHHSRLAHKSSSVQHVAPGHLVAYVSYRTAPSFRPSPLLRAEPACHLPAIPPARQPPILPSCPVPGLKKCPCKGAAEGQQWCGRSVVPQPESTLGSAWGPAA